MLEKSNANILRFSNVSNSRYRPRPGIMHFYRVFYLSLLPLSAENDARASVMEMGYGLVILKLFLRFSNLVYQDFNIRAHFVGESQIISLPVNPLQPPEMTFCPTCGIFHNLLSRPTLTTIPN